MPQLNAPAVVEEITVLHDAYERALVANDVEALVQFFWDSPHVVRFGVSEHLYGAEAIVSYRQGHTPAYTDRKLLRRTVVTFRTDLASVMCELSLTVHGQPRHSRQSQTWVKFPALGWKIISAHVSNALGPPELWEAYTDVASAAIGLSIAATHRPGVVQNLTRAAAIAGPLLAFNLPPETEPAPVFTA
ncbi:MAG TPA: AtzH-like domain-containing protein [Opitutaceae bacterium]|nr:AtzH-like domain-containing protein [Opitutaceae bacterium]